MKNEIREAYERMNPPKEARERMMKNIMKKKAKREGFYTAAPTRERWWTAIPAALALVAVLMVGWKVLIPSGEGPMTDDPIATVDQTEAPVNVELDILHLDELFPDVPEQFISIVGDYYSGLKTNADLNGWKKLGLNPYAYENLDVIEGLGYALMDLDGNGKEELLITDGDQVYDLYVEVDGEIRELLAGRIDAQGKRNSIKLCEDKTLMVWQTSSGAFLVHWWRLGKDGLGMTALVCEETVSLDSNDNWFTGPSDKDAVEVSEEKAQEVLDSRDTVYVNYTPICPEKFGNYFDGIPAGYAYVIEKYEKAATEEWTREEYMQSDISYLLASKNIYWQYGYAQMDLNGDGSNELIITDGKKIYDVFMLMEDGGAGHIISATDERSYFLCKDNIIGCQTLGADATSWDYSRLLAGGDSEIVMYVQKNGDNWYKIEGRSDAVETISHEEADELIGGTYWRVEIPFQTILRLEPAEELIYPRTYVQLLREMMGEYSGIETMYVALTDVTGDGHDEMLLGLGPQSNFSFGHVYSVINGGVSEILTYGSDIDFTLCKDGIICHHQADKPFGNYTFISLKGGEYDIIEVYSYDENEKSWARVKDGVRENISDAEMQEILDSYGSVSLEWMSVLEAIA